MLFKKNDSTDFNKCADTYEPLSLSDPQIAFVSSVSSEKYQETLTDIKEIYNEDLSPTAVYLAHDLLFQKVDNLRYNKQMILFGYKSCIFG